MKYMEQLTRNYMGEDDRTASDDYAMERASIIWPTDGFSKECYARRIWAPVSHIAKAGYTGGMFLNPKQFEEMADDVKGLMKIYEPNPCVGEDLNGEHYRIPHIKTYSRVMSEVVKDKFLRDAKGVTAKFGDSLPVSWFMLTSACLSRGAQGYMVANRELQSDNVRTVEEQKLWGLADAETQLTSLSVCLPTCLPACLSACLPVYLPSQMHYANFELGVVFTSKLTGDGDQVLYVTKGEGGNVGVGSRHPCEMEDGGGGVNIVTLPVPYNSKRAKKYVVDDGDPDAEDYNGGAFRWIPHFNSHEGLRTFSKCTQMLPLPEARPSILVASRGKFNHSKALMSDGRGNGTSTSKGSNAIIDYTVPTFST